jgi:hypothetical protein
MDKRLSLLLIISVFALNDQVSAYTAIAVGSGENANSEHFGYEHLPQPRDLVEKRALENCALSGGKNPKIVLSSAGSGYYAVASGSVGKGRVLGWAGPLANEKAAADAAIANCKQRGGSDPKVKARWTEHR